ncbi:hypothetical protein D3C83_240880 [compost metagenome]
MHPFHQLVEFSRRYQPRFLATGTDVDHADTVVRVEYRQRIARADPDPVREYARRAQREGV